MSKHGPDNPQIRLVLMTVSLHMNADGSGAWPSQQTIAVRSGLGERTVRRHVDTAERTGWVERANVRRAKGRNWFYTKYAATVPEYVYNQLPERPWEADPNWRQEPATVAARQPNEVPETATGGQARHNTRPMATRQPATQSTTPGHSGRLILPLNSSSNSTSEGALARTAGGVAVETEQAEKENRIREWVRRSDLREIYSSPDKLARTVPPAWRFHGCDKFIQEVWRESEATCKPN